MRWDAANCQSIALAGNKYEGQNMAMEKEQENQMNNKRKKKKHMARNSWFSIVEYNYFPDLTSQWIKLKTRAKQVTHGYQLKVKGWQCGMLVSRESQF